MKLDDPAIAVEIHAPIPSGINAGKTHLSVFLQAVKNCIIKDGCWNWSGPAYRNGYGRFNMRGSGVLAHRMSFFVFNRVMPKKQVLHRCDNPACINPAHLFEGDARDNILDCIAKGRHNPPRGENAQKSKLTEANVIEIKNRIANGERQYLLAREFGVSQKQISVIARGIQWAHIK